ncbi:MAG TPA: TonB-dependent receptor, partial [Draconibacterium sp.]|nr:TonB-dependent receptor [Draconibacterium sp.]
MIFGQEEEAQIYLKKQNTNWEEFVKNIEQEYNVRFFYNTDSIPNINISVEKDSILLEQMLSEVFSGCGVHVSKDNNGNYFLFKEFTLQTDINEIFFKPPEPENEPKLNGAIDLKTNGSSNEFLKTYKELISDNLIIGSGSPGNSKNKVRVSGIVFNAGDGTPIGQARMLIPEINRNFITGTSGNFEMDVLPGNYTLIVNSMGMFEKTFKLTVLSGGEVNIPLQVKSFLLDETVVTAERNQNVGTTTMGFEKITAKTIKELPVVLGEKDVVKMVLLLPGVQTVGEISSGFNVRGSPSDQNMFYINDLPIYNSSHLFGLFTTFNSDAIGEFKFYKNSIPVEYGGQLSSIFDIDVKKGNSKYFSALAGVGPTSVRALVEGPLKKDLSSYLVSFRSSYSDWLLNQVDNLDVKNSAASFQDALMDFSFQLNKNNKLGLFFYWSHDYADLAFGIENEYSNLGSDIKWTHTFNKKLSGELNFATSRYSYEEANYEVEYLANQHSFDLMHNELKLNFRYNIGKGHNVQLGLNSKLIQLNNGDFLPLNDQSTVMPLTFESEQSAGNSIFGGYTWDVSSRLTFDAGMRATLYSYLGPKTVYSYMENAPKDVENITDTTFYGNNEIINNYQNLDFSFSGKFEITNDFSIKASFSRAHQYTFMLS